MGSQQAKLEVATRGTGSVQRVEWSRCGARLACWCSEPPAVHVFERQGWTRAAVIPFDGFAQSTRGLLYGIHDIVHVSWAGSLEDQEGVSFCGLTLPGFQALGVQAGPERMDFQLVHATSEMPAGQSDVLPAISPDGAFLAVVDRTFKLRVVRCSTREVVLQKALHLPRAEAPSEEHTQVITQLFWLRTGSALLAVLGVENIDPPLCVNLALLTFDESW